MDKLLQIDMLKQELRETQKMYLEVLNIIDKIKIKLVNNEKISKKELIKIIDEV